MAGVTLRGWQDDRRIRTVSAILLPLLVCLVLVPVRNALPNTAAALVVVVAVVAVAANGRRVEGVLAAASAAVCFDLFLTEPYGQLTITDRGDLETTALLLLVGAAVTELAVRGRRHRIVAQLESGYLDAITATTDLVASNAPAATVVRQVAADLTDLLGARSCTFQRGRAGGMPRLLADGRLRIADGFWPVDRAGLPDLDIEILAERRGTSHGRFVISPAAGSHPTPMARQVAKLLADQVGAAEAHHESAR